MKKTKTFSAEGLTIKLKIEGKVHEEVGKFYNALVHQINLSMQDVMNRVATEKMPNQPQKQPEGEYKCGTLEVLKNPKLRKELLQMDNQVIKKNLTTEKQPEKQEEWREIDICKNCFGNNIGRKYHDADYKKGVKAIGIKVCLDCGCEDICNLGDLSQLLSEEYQRGVKEATEGKFYKKVEFVSEIPKEIVDQLLSERTFTKEELKRISKRVNEYDKDSYEDELDCEIVEKIDNLLKEEE